uniref:Cytochrome c oxidase subunit 2 n=1 Tax=Yuukianura szeptyckii TaxID=1453868 RepID=A0A7T0M4G1_9HEXA|nr:cytochrome c oxidase subunit II [Yuukianura szeptyckii]QPL15822.1 cytochrome oxidase subunit 2 [Yuukianura szeptyckii]
MPSFFNLSFQNASSPLMEELIFFHDHTLMILILITMIVFYNIVSITLTPDLNKFMSESQTLEMFWTITPTFILIMIGGPSIRLLYMLDEVYTPMISIKVMGHQWYWSYEYSDFNNIEFDSFLVPFNSNQTNNYSSLRLLDVDNRLIIPFNTQIRTLVSATDVLHSWTIPSLGVKTDAIPGRLNQLNFLVNRPGLFFGQCSEICGANHSFMPITLESVNSYTFINWVNNFIN